jgi:site-specific recombinase XerD
VVVLDFSGKHGKSSTLATNFEAFLSDIAQIERRRPHTVRAYRYELAAAAADVRFRRPLGEVRLDDLEEWLARLPAATSTVARRVATLRGFFARACPSRTVRAESVDGASSASLPSSPPASSPGTT